MANCVCTFIKKGEIICLLLLFACTLVQLQSSCNELLSHSHAPMRQPEHLHSPLTFESGESPWKSSLHVHFYICYLLYFTTILFYVIFYVSGICICINKIIVIFAILLLFLMLCVLCMFTLNLLQCKYLSTNCNRTRPRTRVTSLPLPRLLLLMLLACWWEIKFALC